jgi:fumarate hydratase, class II
MMKRIEKDSMGEVEVSVKSLWGAQTERSLKHFNIGSEKMPYEVIQSIIQIKKAAAKVNLKLNKMTTEKATGIIVACDLLLENKHQEHFPLSVWQTGSGTQSNMNVNEVIAHLTQVSVHPNDDVNMGQSSNDVFPSAMHISTAIKLNKEFLPILKQFRNTLSELSLEYSNIVKIGRTHLQDATPITLGQEISAWMMMMDQNINMIEQSFQYLYPLAMGATAVGTGLNTHPIFGKMIAEVIAEETGLPFLSSMNKFHALSSKDAMVHVHSSLKTLAVNLLKIANDVRWLASGPRAGIGEINIPENEPGSSIMPGKVNPTQAEALSMVCMQVFGNDTTISYSASQGNFQLNVFMPVIIYNMLQTIQLLKDAILSFDHYCVAGIKPNLDVIHHNLENSLMLVTALSPHIGYDKAAIIAKYAHEHKCSLKKAGVQLSYVTEEEFDLWVNPKEMV